MLASLSSPIAFEYKYTTDDLILNAKFILGSYKKAKQKSCILEELSRRSHDGKIEVTRQCSGADISKDSSSVDP